MNESENHVKNSVGKQIIFVDIDETICYYETDERIYERALPIVKNIKKINDLFDTGNQIVYWTARGSTQPNNNERLSYLKTLTINQLKDWNASYHELKIGDEKPFYDMIIDDKAKRIEEL